MPAVMGSERGEGGCCDGEAQDSRHACSCCPCRSRTAMMVLMEMRGGRRCEPWRSSRNSALCTPLQSPCTQHPLSTSSIAFNRVLGRMYILQQGPY